MIRHSLRLIAASLFIVLAYQGSADAETRPNIILIITDDQRYDMLSYMPKLGDALVNKGTLFNNAVVTTPLCCPSRASILTGQYAHNHGVEQNDRTFADEFKTRDANTLATWLKEGGYRTGLIGKYLNGYRFGYIPPGWDNFEVFVKKRYYNYSLTNFKNDINGPRVTYGSNDQDYATDVVFKKAIEFVLGPDQGSEQPFFLMLTPNAPHKPATPARRHQDVFKDIPPHRPPSFNEPDMSDKAFWARSLWSKARKPMGKKKIQRIDRLRQNMLESLLAVDEGIENLVRALGEKGKIDNTVIIFLGGDNGYHLGEHRLTDKRSPYEESIRTSLVVFDGRNPVKRISNAVVANVDLAPTILELAGLKPQDKVDGKSFVSIVRGSEQPIRKYILLQHFYKTITSGSTPFLAVRSDHSIYIRWRGWIRDGEEYYDLNKDPYQLDNAIANPANQAEIEEMRAALEGLRNCAGETCK